MVLPFGMLNRTKSTVKFVYNNANIVCSSLDIMRDQSSLYSVAEIDRVAHVVPGSPPKHSSRKLPLHTIRPTVNVSLFRLEMLCPVKLLTLTSGGQYDALNDVCLG